MTQGKTKAIRSFCLDCAGSPLGATLCTILYCDLWEHRIGGLKTETYKNRINSAFLGHSLALKEAQAIGLALEDFLHPTKDAIKKTRPLEQSTDDRGANKQTK